MKGALTQVTFQGVENMHINMNPEFTFFKAVYKRYNNFSMESIEQTFTSTLKFNSTQRIKINKEGELLSKVYLQVTLPHDVTSTAQWVKRVGYKLIDRIELIIGNKVVDKQYGMWNYIWSEVSHTNSKKSLLDNMVGDTTGLYANESHTLIIPLQFFFCRHYGLSLPLNCLYKEDVYIKFYMSKKADCISSGTAPSGELSNASIWCDYIYIEKEDNIVMVQSNPEYLYDTTEIIRKNLVTNGLNTITLPFTKPCKELLFTVDTEGGSFGDFNDINNVQLKISGKNVFSSGARDKYYTNAIVPHYCHTGVPANGINCINFALKPEELQPSGHINFSYSPSVTMLINSNKGLLHLFSFCYNVLKINKGVSSLEYV